MRRSRKWWEAPAAERAGGPQVPFAACVERWAAGDVVDDKFSAALGRKTAAHVAPRFTSFPPYLIVQIRKWAPPLHPKP